MGYLGWPEFLQVVTAITAILAGIFASLFKLKSEDGDWNKKGVVFVFVLVIAACASIGISFHQASKNYQEREISEDRYQRDSTANQKTYVDIINRSEATLRSANRSLNGIGVTINRLEQLQHESNLILDSLGKDLELQRQLNASAKRLLLQQQIQIENSDRLLNPVNPFHLYISAELSFSDPNAKSLIERIVLLRAKLESDSNYHNEHLKIVRNPSSNKIMYVSILNYQDFFEGFSSLFKYDKSYQFGFIRDSLRDHLVSPDISKSVIYCKPLFRTDNTDTNVRKKFSRMNIHFENEMIELNTYFTDFTYYKIIEVMDEYFGLRDLENSFVWFRLIGASNTYKLKKLEFYFGRSFTLPVDLSLMPQRFNSFNEGYYIHKIQKFEVQSMGQKFDNYKIYYYNEGTRSLSLEDPD